MLWVLGISLAIALAEFASLTIQHRREARRASALRRTST